MISIGSRLSGASRLGEVGASGRGAIVLNSCATSGNGRGSPWTGASDSPSCEGWASPSGSRESGVGGTSTPGLDSGAACGGRHGARRAGALGAVYCGGRLGSLRTGWIGVPDPGVPGHLADRVLRALRCTSHPIAPMTASAVATRGPHHSR